MNEYILIKNAYKAPVKRVFDYLNYNSLKNPNPKQKLMLSEICDGVDIFEEKNNEAAKNKMQPGDYLYEVYPFNKETNLICIVPPKKIKPLQPNN